jgi:hypothetical protein
MSIAAYFHRQAETCLSLARLSDDVVIVERLQIMACDFMAKAFEAEEQDLPRGDPSLVKSVG